MQDFAVGDHVQMRKKHPCGSDEWVIYRMGADIGLRVTARVRVGDEVCRLTGPDADNVRGAEPLAMQFAG